MTYGHNTYKLVSRN